MKEGLRGHSMMWHLLGTGTRMGQMESPPRFAFIFYDFTDDTNLPPWFDPGSKGGPMSFDAYVAQNPTPAEPWNLLEVFAEQLRTSLAQPRHRYESHPLDPCVHPMELYSDSMPPVELRGHVPQSGQGIQHHRCNASEEKMTGGKDRFRIRQGMAQTCASARQDG